jgi:hypothetical protein
MAKSSGFLCSLIDDCGSLAGAINVPCSGLLFEYCHGLRSYCFDQWLLFWDSSAIIVMIVG